MAKRLFVLRATELTGVQLQMLMYNRRVETLCSRGPYFVCMAEEGYKHNFPVVEEPEVYAALVDYHVQISTEATDEELHELDARLTSRDRQ